MPIEKFSKIMGLVNKTGRNVFSLEQLARLSSRTYESARVLAHYLVKNGNASYLRRGVITFSTDNFVNASQLVEPAYISCGSALFHHGLVQQVQYMTTAVTTARSVSLEDIGIRYRRIPPDLFYGYDIVRIGNTYYNMATKEKAIIDMVYLQLMTPATWQIASKMKKDVLWQLAKRYNGHGSKKMHEMFFHD